MRMVYLFAYMPFCTKKNFKSINAQKYPHKSFHAKNNF